MQRLLLSVFCLLVTVSFVYSQVRCGSDFEGKKCSELGFPGYCCSNHGYCGTTDDYCSPGNCQSDCKTNPPTPPTPNPTNKCSSKIIRLPDYSKPCADSSQFRYTVTECDIYNIMGQQSPLGRSDITEAIVDTLETYDLNCSPKRIAAFLAQVRHETANLQTFYQPIDGGAGAIHMIPANYRIACKQLPALEAAFREKFGENCDKSNVCDCGSNSEAAEIVGQPQFAFLTAGWWFKTGSKQLLGSPCGDLRTDADIGLGSQDPLTGYYKISRCIFGGSQDAGLQQRVNYYQQAMRVANSFKNQRRESRTLADNEEE
ncbi:hypothetical protein ABK040_009426 [Willaertia magna]